MIYVVGASVAIAGIAFIYWILSQCLVAIRRGEEQDELR